MEQRIRTDLMNFKKSIDKSLGEDNYEHLLDTLNAVAHDFVISAPTSSPILNPELIRNTKIGATVAEVKRKYQSIVQANTKSQTQSRTATHLAQILEQAKILLVYFKRVIENDSKQSTAPAAAASADSATSKPQQQQPPKQSLSSISELSEHRCKIIELLSEALTYKPDTVTNNTSKKQVDPKVQETAMQVEAAINALHPYDGSTKQYGSKARTLIFNLKKNQVSCLIYPMCKV